MSPSSRRILVVDQNKSTGQALQELLASWGYEALFEDNGAPSLESILKADPTVIIDSNSLAADENFTVLRDLRAQPHGVPVILLAGSGLLEMAKRAVKEEFAYHYFEQPVDADKLRVALDRAVELTETRRENEVLRRELENRGAFGELVGSSPVMREIYSLIEQIAPSSASVLITGESGTGKEVLARTIHNLSPRKNAQFVAINCSAIPETLMESELFGHEKGSFTGAANRRQGCFELANGGTLLLDEIGEMPILLQSKLLRVLEERSVRRLGSTQEIPVDVRVLAATNKNPFDLAGDGTFRGDLLYRLNVIDIELPPLRKRKEDIPLLAQHLVTQLAAKHNRPAPFLTPAAIEILSSHSWPGNVRELRNVLERAVIICAGEELERHHFAPGFFD